jgi:hypothetical protein
MSLGSLLQEKVTANKRKRERNSAKDGKAANVVL